MLQEKRIVLDWFLSRLTNRMRFIRSYSKYVFEFFITFFIKLQKILFIKRSIIRNKRCLKLTACTRSLLRFTMSMSIPDLSIRILYVPKLQLAFIILLLLTFLRSVDPLRKNENLNLKVFLIRSLVKKGLNRIIELSLFVKLHVVAHHWIVLLQFNFQIRFQISVFRNMSLPNEMLATYKFTYLFKSRQTIKF